MQRRPFSFRPLGYRRNPFGALSGSEWAEIAVLPAAVTTAVADETHHVQLIGPAGSGKTTALRRLWRDLRSSHLHVVYEYLPEGQRHFVTPLQPLDIFLLDEAQRLSWWQRRRWLNWAQHGNRRTLFSSHQDLSAQFTRRDMALHTLHVDRLVTRQSLAAQLARRLAFFAIEDAERITLSADGIDFLYETFGVALREMEYFLYEVWQQQEAVGEVTAVDLQRIYDRLP